ncbi:MAG TPA: peptide deformylase, partial [Pyrinomonadaceae bacterium]
RQIKRIPFHVIINPHITARSDETVMFFEGCLSVMAYRALVPRHRRIKVECLNEFGEKQVIEAQGWYARILQHEIDHLEGNLFVDKMCSKSLISQELYVKQKWDYRLFSEMKENFLKDE